MSSSLIKAFYLSQTQRHKYGSMILGAIFLVWCVIDFALTEPYSAFFTLIRFSITSVIVLISSDLNKELFKKYNTQFLGSFLFIITTASFVMFISSQNPYYYFAQMTLVFIISPIIFSAELKYIIPSMLVPVVGCIISQGTLETLPSTSITMFALIGISIILVSTIAHITLFKIALQNSTLNDEIKNQKKKLEVLFDENNQLIRILCHDLGNTITIIEMSTDLIEFKRRQLDINDDQLTKSIERIKRAVSTQNEIINHVKEKEAVDSGKLEIELKPISINVVIEKVKFIFQEPLSEKNIKFEVNFTNEKHPYVLAEMVSLTNNVLNNIMSNAIKFSYDNSEIILSCWKEDTFVYLTVEDFGVGMNDELVKNVFKSNVKTNRPGVKGEKGTGFGIPLAYSYMQKYGGDIYVESWEGKGTRFTLKFKAIDSVTS